MYIVYIGTSPSLFIKNYMNPNGLHLFKTRPSGTEKNAHMLKYPHPPFQNQVDVQQSIFL